MHQVVRERNVNQFIELNSAFHNKLLAICGNEQLWSLLQPYRDQYFDRCLVRVFNTGDWRVMTKQHQKLFDTVRQRDPHLAPKKLFTSTS
jgi:DNA-binding GntR family transcriptional regulator